MKKSIHILVMFLLATGILFGSRAWAVKHVVLVGNFFFNPTSLSVNVGDTVRWVWSAGTHTTTSNPGGIPAGAAPWDALISSTMTSFEYKVTVAGSYAYVCTPHAPGMAGTFTAVGAVPTLSVTPSNRDVTAPAGSTAFSVTSNTTWTAVSNAGWCAVTPNGSGNGTIAADYTENTSLNPRTASITVSVSGLPSQTVTVNQAGAAPVLSVSPANQSVPESSGNTSFSITSNTAWQASSDADWCVVTPSGTGNGTLSATFSANTQFAVRIAHITVTVSGLAPQVVTVTQASSTVGTAEHTTSVHQVYPNPTKGIFDVKITGITGESSQISILDMTGKTVGNQSARPGSEARFDLTGNSPGCYFIRIRNGSSNEIIKLFLTK